MIDRVSRAAGAVGIVHEEPFLESAGLPDDGKAGCAAAIIEAGRSLGRKPRRIAARYGTNASVFAAGGVPCVVFGPGSIEQAHTADEWIDLAQVEAAADMLVAVARRG